MMALIARRQALQDDALSAVREERSRQHVKWGTQRHDFPVWLTVLSEEVGELSREILVLRELDPDAHYARRMYLQNARKEAVQVAAVAIALIEHLGEQMLDEQPDPEPAREEK